MKSVIYKSVKSANFISWEMLFDFLCCTKVERGFSDFLLKYTSKSQGDIVLFSNTLLGKASMSANEGGGGNPLSETKVFFLFI